MRRAKARRAIFAYRTRFAGAVERLEARVLLSTYTVTTAADSGAGSLRDAIQKANGNPGADVIQFAIPGTGVQTISPAAALDSITDPLTIDATTQPGYAGTPLIQIDGAAAGAADGFYVTAGNCTFKGLDVTHWQYSGFLLYAASGNTIQNCYIGVDPSGTTAAGSTNAGVFIGGGAAANQLVNDVISGNGTAGAGGTYAQGVYITDPGTSRNVIAGCLIGTNAAGTAAIPNAGAGVFVGNGATANRIGTDGNGVGDASERNVISGNGYEGVAIGGAGTSGTIVAGNYIGINAAGTAALSNGTNGLLIYNGASNTRVGVLATDADPAAEANVVSGNTWNGIYVGDPGTTGNVVAGNFIGTDPLGHTSIANGNNGLVIGNGGQSNRIGTDGNGVGDELERNVISGNTWSGVAIYGTYDPANPSAYVASASTNNNIVAGNYIGTDWTGKAPLPNMLCAGRTVTP